MNANLALADTEDYVSARHNQSGLSANCQKCGTELKWGAEFCHVCGRWVYGLNLARFLKRAKLAVGQTRIELPVLICMLVAGLFAVISLFVGIRVTPKTLGEWQVIQFWRIEWLLGAIVVLLFGVLLKKKP